MENAAHDGDGGGCTLVRILVVCQRYWPEQFQITSICEGLVGRGHSVTVLAGLPNVGVPNSEPGIVVPSYRHGAIREEKHNGVRILRTFEVGRRSDIVHRVLNYYSFWHSAKRKARRLEKDFDVVLAYQLSPAMMAIPAVEYKRVAGAPVLLYCCDLWPESLKAILGERGKAIISHYGKICRDMYRAIDRVAIQSPTFTPYFTDYHNVPSEKLVYIPQFATDGSEQAAASLPHEGVNLVFMGNMGAVQGIPMMIEAVSLLGDIKGLMLHFVGDGMMRSEAEKLVSELGMEDKVVFHGRKQVDELLEYYELADICILSLDDSTLIGTTIPSKLQGYMGAGRAVVGAVSGGARYVIEESGCGIATPPGDARAFADAIRVLATDSSRRSACAQAARVYFEENFTLGAYLDALESELESLARER